MAKKKPKLGNLMDAMASMPMKGKGVPMKNNPKPAVKPTAKKKTAANKPTTKTKCKKGC